MKNTWEHLIIFNFKLLYFKCRFKKKKKKEEVQFVPVSSDE